MVYERPWRLLIAWSNQRYGHLQTAILSPIPQPGLLSMIQILTSAGSFKYYY